MDAASIEAEVIVPWRLVHNTDRVLADHPVVRKADSLWGSRASPAQRQAKLDAGHFPSHKQFLGRILPLCKAGRLEQLTSRQVACCRRCCDALDNWEFEDPAAKLAAVDEVLETQKKPKTRKRKGNGKNGKPSCTKEGLLGFPDCQVRHVRNGFGGHKGDRDQSRKAAIAIIQAATVGDRPDAELEALEDCELMGKRKRAPPSHLFKGVSRILDNGGD